jgi:hypothetical protein
MTMHYHFRIVAVTINSTDLSLLISFILGVINEFPVGNKV